MSILLSGDTESLWKVDKLRSETYNQHTFLLLFLVQRLTHLCFYLVLLMFITFIAYTRRVSSLKVNLKKLLPSSSLSARWVQNLGLILYPFSSESLDLQICVCLWLCRHMVTEFKKLVNEWPVEVIRHQAEEDKKVLKKNSLPVMFLNSETKSTYSYLFCV